MIDGKKSEFEKEKDKYRKRNRKFKKKRLPQEYNIFFEF